MPTDHVPDVLILGGGNAALCAAIAARETGADVLVIDRAPAEQAGGSSRYATGTVRIAYDGVDSIRKLVPELGDEEAAETDFGSYTVESYLEDLGRLSGYRADPDLADTVASESYDVTRWMAGHGLRFLPMYGRQAFSQSGHRTFWGGCVVEVVGGGAALVDGLTRAAIRLGVQVRYETAALRLIETDGRVRGAVVHGPGGAKLKIQAGAVMIATGGFDANAEWRARYLGPNWDLARSRGSSFTVGDGIAMGLAAGAAPAGHWSGSHAVAWESNAPEAPSITESSGMSRHSYPLGIMVNSRGQRFVDEGADFRNYTYGLYGGAVLAQPGQVAWQIFDAKVIPLLREEYRGRAVTKVVADRLDDLARRMDGVDAVALLRTVGEFNAAIRADIPFHAAVKDGRHTSGLAVPKSNWANTLDTGPFEAFGVTCGVSFTYGGLRIDADGRVLDATRRPIPGLFAAGATAGGLFYGNSASGSSLTSGSVLGRRAGRAAAQAALA
jgi:tricarballylate dehydrogenase